MTRKSIFQENGIMHVNLFFDGLSNGKLLAFTTGPPCILTQSNSKYKLSFFTQTIKKTI